MVANPKTIHNPLEINLDQIPDNEVIVVNGKYLKMVARYLVQQMAKNTVNNPDDNLIKLTKDSAVKHWNYSIKHLLKMKEEDSNIKMTKVGKFWYFRTNDAKEWFKSRSKSEQH